jgi:hypothetical protein
MQADLDIQRQHAHLAVATLKWKGMGIWHGDFKYAGTTAKRKADSAIRGCARAHWSRAGLQGRRISQSTHAGLPRIWPPFSVSWWRYYLLDVLRHAGVKVLWRDNNSGCKGVCERVESQEAAVFELPEYCVADECYDEGMLSALDD